MPKDDLITSRNLNPNGKQDLVLKEGCYLIRYVPAELMESTVFFEGTMRIMRVLPDGNRAGAKDHDTFSAQIKAGADLYARRIQQPQGSNGEPDGISRLDPSRYKKQADKDGSSIPIFPRELYRYYLEVTQILENAPAVGEVSILMSIHEFNQETEWSNPGTRWVCLQRVPSTDRYREYFSGNVIDQGSGAVVGTLSLCRISDYLRHATVAIHRVNGVDSFPGENVHTKGSPAEAAWKEAFREAGWNIRLRTTEKPDLKSIDGDNIWTTSELQQALYAMRIRDMVEPGLIRKADKTKHLERMTQAEIEKIPGLSNCLDPLDTEWLYHLLCVPRIDGFDRGVMFDTYGSDSQNLPREGAAVAAEWVFGDDAKSLENNGSADRASAQEIRERWAQEDGKQLQAVAKVFFRVAVHEIGHAMGLDHNFKDYGFMNTTDTVADDELTAEKSALEANLQSILLERLPPESKILEEAKRLGKIPGHFEHVAPFPGFVNLHFQADDLNRLRFGPDIAIRPGTSFNDPGPLFGDAASAPADGLQLEATPLLNSVPFGAPVRINVKITNTSNQAQPVPFSLSLKSGIVDGRVLDPIGNERAFWPLKKWEDSDPGGELAPGQSKTYAMTLLRGPQKALFPVAGDHRVRVRATWDCGADSVYLESETTVRVTEPVDDNHRTAGLKVISTPDALLSLALVGDQFKQGTDAIKTAIANPVLRPHFALIHAKLLLSGPNEFKPDVACDLIDDAIVMSFDEIDSLSELLEKTCRAGAKLDGAKLRDAVQCLYNRVRMLRAQGGIEAVRAGRTIDRLSDLLNRTAYQQRTGVRGDALTSLASSAKPKPPAPESFHVEFEK